MWHHYRDILQVGKVCIVIFSNTRSVGIPDEYRFVDRRKKYPYDHQEFNTEVDGKVKLGEVCMIFRTSRSCFMRSKRGGHGWPLTEMTMQIGRV